MRIANQSGYNIDIDGNTISTGEEYEADEMMFNSVSIHSDIGSVEITTEYSKRSFRNYGNLKAYEDETLKDAQGLPQINVIKRCRQ